MAYAVVAQNDGYLLAVMHQYGGRVEWELINVPLGHWTGPLQRPKTSRP